MHSDVFSVIADPTRRRIVRILAEQTHTVGAVVEKLGMSQPTISKHLKVLRDADVVSVTVEGQRRLYSLNPDVFATVTEWINETVQIARQSNEAHVPVALPGGATAPAENKAADKAPEKVAVRLQKSRRSRHLRSPPKRLLPRRLQLRSPPLRPRRRLRSPLLPRRPALRLPLLRLLPLRKSSRHAFSAPAPST